MNEKLLILVDELENHINKIKAKNHSVLYYNEILGDTSFLLAVLLDSLLKNNYEDWDNSKWFDDCLISELTIQNDKVKLFGVMIWGKYDTTEQWTEPFAFEVDLLNQKNNNVTFKFLFSDLDNPEITYENFSKNRDYWSVKNRKWKYIIKSKKLS